MIWKGKTPNAQALRLSALIPSRGLGTGRRPDNLTASSRQVVGGIWQENQEIVDHRTTAHCYSTFYTQTFRRRRTHEAVHVQAESAPAIPTTILPGDIDPLPLLGTAEQFTPDLSADRRQFLLFLHKSLQTVPSVVVNPDAEVTRPLHLAKHGYVQLSSWPPRKTRLQEDLFGSQIFPWSGSAAPLWQTPGFVPGGAMADLLDMKLNDGQKTKAIPVLIPKMWMWSKLTAFGFHAPAPSGLLSTTTAPSSLTLLGHAPLHHTSPYGISDCNFPSSLLPVPPPLSTAESVPRRHVRFSFSSSYVLPFVSDDEYPANPPSASLYDSSYTYLASTAYPGEGRVTYPRASVYAQSPYIMSSGARCYWVYRGTAWGRGKHVSASAVLIFESVHPIEEPES
ncbi:hypothetical protein BDP27DRAFT_1496542 [Rhodocollybia butyracea]|uniref:Uncharacterized protein n=1 Tax=Rhodocollybia butyracea TaxID=206335 RepID=A0A9P5Q0Q4_9AGAR|nr:hypothetical protein BDP27DRAFT_1496542 [Rhodocollybia butyracea]